MGKHSRSRSPRRRSSPSADRRRRSGERDRSRSPPRRDRSKDRGSDRSRSGSRGGGRGRGTSRRSRSRSRSRGRSRGRSGTRGGGGKGGREPRDKGEERGRRGRSPSRSRSSSRSSSSSSGSRSRSRERKRRSKKEKKGRKEKKEKRGKKEKRHPKTERQEDPPAFTDDMGLGNFGDSNVTERFVWKKKREMEAKMGITEEEALRRDLARRGEIMEEIEKLKVRKEQREYERALQEQEMMRQQRLREMEMFGDMESKEDEFHLEQAKVRAEIRIKEGRAKPIDVLALNLNLENPDVEISIEEPYKIFAGLTLEEVEELKRDINVHYELEKTARSNKTNQEFWEAMLVVCDDEEARLRSGFEGGVVHQSVREDIEKVLGDKSKEQLEILRKSVTEKLATGKTLDVEYWETMLRKIGVFQAKARLREIHEDILNFRLEQLKERQKREAQEALQEVSSSMPKVQEEEEEDLAGGMSPVPGDLPDPLPDNAKILDPEEDWQAILDKRESIRKSRYEILAAAAKQPGASRNPKANEDEEMDALMAANARRITGERFDDEEDEAFAVDIPMETQMYLWQDKYRPRKPRYFNRVITGFEWNKYNQTHYDPDNPPPKVILGYKFNIFYPHLIDNSVAPTYKIIKDPQSKDGSTVLIQFQAGPPYEDIAFRVVKREWEHSHKRGFRSQFDKGVLQLHFRFMRYRYRK